MDQALSCEALALAYNRNRGACVYADMSGVTQADPVRLCDSMIPSRVTG
ncbi:MAG: hypothetical protein QOF69_28 [Solirubrobacteraceae bacterium]|jgi:hypothetical protein|nr:hypothetical protein [Solirubrobacteraceae bacterium]